MGQDPDGALVEYREQKDDLYAGLVPRRSPGALDLAYALDYFLASKKADLQEGRIVPRTYWELDRTCDLELLGRHASIVSSIAVTDQPNSPSSIDAPAAEICPASIDAPIVPRQRRAGFC